jgi:hypothetical protein
MSDEFDRLRPEDPPSNRLSLAIAIIGVFVGLVAAAAGVMTTQLSGLHDDYNHLSDRLSGIWQELSDANNKQTQQLNIVATRQQVVLERMSDIENRVRQLEADDRDRHQKEMPQQ